MEVKLINTQKIAANWLDVKEVSLDVLRLDKIHPLVSGNKWFKLKYYLHEAKELNKTTIATFGGAWSNHIIATAFACKQAGIKSIGIIRGEEQVKHSETLKAATGYGMQLHFVTREMYRDKEVLKARFSVAENYWINEGGYGLAGAKGASEILKITDASRYTHIIASVGTGTMLAGLIMASDKNQQVIGISSMKGNNSLQQQIFNLLGDQKSGTPFQIMHDYHFGGYGKHPQPLIDYINNVYQQFQLPLDIVYTAKTFYAIEDLVNNNFFQAGSKLLMIHSGGLQGNNSLKAKVLVF